MYYSQLIIQTDVLETNIQNKKNVPSAAVIALNAPSEGKTCC